MFTKTAKSSKQMVIVGVTIFVIGLLGGIILALEFFRDTENEFLLLCSVLSLSIGILVFFVLERIANHRVKRQFTMLHLDKKLRKGR